MVDWKVRSKIYHMMTPEPGDDLAKEEIIEEFDPEVIAVRAQRYWRTQTKELYYPAKSYAVAVTYALMLSEIFGGNIISYLKDPELLAGNDPYFEPYNDNNYRIYHEVIPDYVFAMKHPELHSDNFKRTLDYFNKEFLLAEDTRAYLPND